MSAPTRRADVAGFLVAAETARSLILICMHPEQDHEPCGRKRFFGASEADCWNKTHEEGWYAKHHEDGYAVLCPAHARRIPE